MDDWQEFKDSRFAFWFKYPSLATNGEHVDRVETRQDGMLRVHVLSPKSREVYFEVSKYDLLDARAEYQRHKAYLPKQFHPLAITELKETFCGSLPAYEYTFEWEQGARAVILIERCDATYRILYNPRSPINMQILSTVQRLTLL